MYFNSLVLVYTLFVHTESEQPVPRELFLSLQGRLIRRRLSYLGTDNPAFQSPCNRKKSPLLD